MKKLQARIAPLLACLLFAASAVYGTGLALGDPVDSDDSTSAQSASEAIEESAGGEESSNQESAPDEMGIQALGAQAGLLQASNARTRLGDINTRFTIYPNESEGGTLNGNNLEIVPVKDGGGVSVTVNLDLSTSGSEPAKPGELEILIPRSIFEVRDMSHAKVDIPYPADGSGDWKYTFVDADGNPVSENSSSCKYIKLVNNISIDPAHTQSMGIAYSVALSSMIKDGSNVDFQPTVTLKKGDSTETKTPDKLNVQVDTQIEIANAAKSTYNSYVTDQWLDAWGDKPDWYTEDKEGKYFFLMWELSAYLKYDSATQPYKLTYAEPSPVPDGGIICGYMDWYSNNSGSGSRDDAEETARLLSAPPVKEVLPRVTPGYSPSGVTKDAWYSGVLVAYPKPTTSPKEYTNTFKATVTPYDGKDDPTSLEAEGKFTYKDLDLNTPTGDMYYLEKLKGWIANGPDYRRLWGGIDRVLAGVPVDDIAYSISGYAYQYTYDADPDYDPTADDPTRNGRLIRGWGAEYTAELVDDMFFLNVDPNCRLGDGDMEITRVNPAWEAYEYHPNMAKGGYVEVEVDYTEAGESGSVSGSWAKNYPELIAYGKSDNGSWQKIAIFAINTEGRAEVKEIHLDGASYYNDETHRGGVNIPKGTGFTQIKYSVTANEGKATEDNKDVIRVRFARRWTPGGEYHSYDSKDNCELYLTLYPTDKVKEAVQAAVDQNVKSDPEPAGGHSNDGDGGEDDDYAPVAKLHNIDHLAVYTGVNSEQARLADLKGADLPQGESDSNFKDVLHDHDVTLYNRDMWHKKAQIELTKYKNDSAIVKSSEYENDPGNYRVIVHYTSQALEATITHDTDIPQELIDYGIIPLQQSGTFYDLLPQGMTVDPASITAEACAADAAVELEYETIANYKGSGRTLLIVRTSTDVANWRTSTNWKNGLTNAAENSLPHIESGFTIHYDGYYDWDSLEDYGNVVTNYIGFESGNDEIYEGVDDDASQWNYTDFSPVEEYFKDLDETEPKYDEDGNPIATPNFLYTNDSTTLTVVTQARYGLTKKITSPTVSGWTNGRVGDGENMQVGVPTGGQYQYRLRYASEPATTVKNMVLFDALEAYEYIRDKKVTVAEDGTPLDPAQPKSDEVDVDRDGYEVVTWQGTFESIDVSKIEAMGAKADIYYTTKARNELQVDDQSDKTDTLADASDPAGSALASCWVGPLSAADINALDDETKATITGLAIDMRKKKNGTDDFELDSGKSVAAIVTMRAPNDPSVVRELVEKAQDQYDAADDADKDITNDKPYAYNAVNMNSSVKQKNSGSYSEAHLITYEYTRAYLYVPQGNISIQKRVTGMSEEEAAAYAFKVKAAVEQPDGSTRPFAGKYNRIDTSTGYYYTSNDTPAPYTDEEGAFHAEGVFVSMSDSEFGPYYVTYDSEAGEWVPCDAEGAASGDQVAAEAASYTFETEEGQEEFAIRGNQRIVLIDCDADLNWTVEEVAMSADGFRTSHTLNGADGEDDYTTAPFVIGDKNTARIVYTNMATSELVIQKKVAVGDEDKKFDFTVKITDASGNEYLDWEGNPQVFDYAGEADEGVDAPANGTLKSGDTIQLMHGQRIRIFVPGGTKYAVTETVPENYENPAIEKKYDTLVAEGDGEETTTRYETETTESDGTGTIKASGDLATETFTNTHVPDEKPKKEVEGNDVVGENESDESADGGEENTGDTNTTDNEKSEGADTTNEEHTHVDLGAYANPFTYTITENVPIETKQMVLTDTLEGVLEFVSTASDVVVLDANGNPVADNTDLKVDISIDDQTLTVTIAYAEPTITDEEGNVVGVKNELDKLVGGQVSFVFVAKIRDGADLAAYVVEDEETGEASVKVSNTAKVQFNNRPAVDTNTVTVTPPPPDEKIEKKVMGKEHYNLRSAEEIYDYTVDVLVPIDATAIEVTDTLEPVLEFATGSDEVTLTYNGQEVDGYAAQISGKTLTVTLEGDAAKAHRTRTLVVGFKARIVEGSDLSPYAKTGSVLVPNTASYEVNNDAQRKFDSEPVTVTPPPPGEFIEKKVMEQDHYDLPGLKDYSYTIDVSVPADAEVVTITDTLEPVLNFANGTDGVEVLFGTEAIDGAKVAISDKTLTVTLDGDVALAHRMHIVTVKLQAIIDENADLSPYMQNGSVVVPNTASYTINNDSSRSFKSNTVTITPPTDNPPTDNPPASSSSTGTKTPAPARTVKGMLAKTGDAANPVALLGLTALGLVASAAANRARRRA